MKILHLLQGRETKIKAVKKKYGQKTRHQNLDSDDDDDKAVSNEQFIIEIVSLDEIREYLMTEESFKDIEGEKDSLIDKISLHLYPQVKIIYGPINLVTYYFGSTEF